MPALRRREHNAQQAMSTPAGEPGDLFWVRYEPQGMLVSTLQMRPWVELAHRRLCDYYWVQGQFPLTSGDGLAVLLRTRGRKLAALLQGLQAAGWRIRRGRLTHADPTGVRRNALEAHAAAIRRGRKGATLRWGGREPALAATPAQAWQPAVEQPPQAARAKRAQIKVPKPEEHTHSTLRAERSAFSAKATGSTRAGETSFLEDVEALWPQDSPDALREMANWGGWWRNRYRENPNKARAVLSEIRNLRKEGRPVTNPGAAAADLWKRLP
jgi:hypothetical protein